MPMSVAEENILREAEWHSKRLGKDFTDASAVSWRHDNAMRNIRNSSDLQKLKSFASLATLNASYRVKISKDI